jgi:opacity protein-like surface antigen
MKKVILTVAAVFAFGFANAQDKKENSGEGFSNGDVFVSGSFGFGSEKTGDEKISGFNIAPKVGFFVADNIAIGGKLGYASTTRTDAPSPDFKTNEFTVGAFGRYYATPSSQFSIFGELGFDYVSGKQEQGANELKRDGFDIAVGPGVSYFLSSNFAMEASWGMLGYSTRKNDTPNAEATNSFGLNVNLSSINFGLVYKF